MPSSASSPLSLECTESGALGLTLRPCGRRRLGPGGPAGLATYQAAPAARGTRARCVSVAAVCPPLCSRTRVCVGGGRARCQARPARRRQRRRLGGSDRPGGESLHASAARGRLAHEPSVRILRRGVRAAAGPACLSARRPRLHPTPCVRQARAPGFSSNCRPVPSKDPLAARPPIQSPLSHLLPVYRGTRWW